MTGRPDPEPGGPPGRCPEMSAQSGHGRRDDPPPAFGPADGLTARQGRAVEALLRESSAARAAAVAGVAERTLRRWTGEPAFRAALSRARREAFGHAVGLTQRYAAAAVEALAAVMQDPASAPSARVTAAAVLLRFGREGLELDDLAGRVERLEDQAGGPRKRVASRAVEPDEDDDDVDEEDVT